MARLVESARLLGTGRDVLRGDMQRREFITLLAWHGGIEVPTSLPLRADEVIE